MKIEKDPQNQYPGKPMLPIQRQLARPRQLVTWKQSQVTENYSWSSKKEIFFLVILKLNRCMI
ncbi:hypothetical protein DCC81_05755 [Chitinophaga parva]|uniref:Uncharacterized protein n=1 Tax=Chitinophaga parva TaxID=2169414 RepID=A0A2T7BMS0_9BACT|nr:hypothetical protein DCC81_05755 [Chitinophaga parva]